MKFGGSSVADPDKIRHVAQRLVEARERGVRVVATVSAMGDTTDGLLELARQVSPEPHPRELDMLLSTGERIACALVAMAVHDLGYEAVSFTGSQAGIITDPVHTKAKIREITPVRVLEALDRGRIVLVAGYQGFSRDTMDVTTLGRGGTDATAVALAAALGASCEIYSDVAGRLHRRPTHRPGRAQARARSRTRRCSRWRRRARRCSCCARSSSHAARTCPSTPARRSRTSRARGSRTPRGSSSRSSRR